MPARSAELKLGRTFGVTLEHGDEFFTELTQFCEEREIKYGYIPTFIGAFKHAKIVGTCHHADANAPMFDSYIDVDFVETIGMGTLAYDHKENKLLPHIHLSVGKRMHGAVGLTSHLFEAHVQFLLEMVVVEVVAPELTRPINRNLFDLRLLNFG